LKNLGAPCTSNDDCASKSCVRTGVGTSMVCCRTCQNSSECGENLCTSDGLACQVHPETDPCGANTGCFNDSSLNDGGHCDGAGACSQASKSCDGFVCADGKCGGSCTVPANGCASGYYCDGKKCQLGSCSSTASCADGYYCTGSGVCAPKKDVGTPCYAAGECTSGLFCVSTGGTSGSVCCSAPCNDGTACGSYLCASDGKTCQVHPKDDPCVANTGCHDEISQYDGGKCSGAGTCTPTILSCGAYACAEGECRRSCTVPANGCASGYYCDGSVCKLGSCGPSTPCASGYYCDGSVCKLGSCSSDASCADGYYCTGGVCASKKDVGTPCSAAGECTSNHCVSTGGTTSVCCATACTATNECGPNLCASDGTSCKVHPATDSCGLTTGCHDTSSLNIIGGNCDGAGACNQATRSCGGFVCAIDACKVLCAGPADCIPGYSCATDGSCKKANGQSCLGGADCASTNCVDGYCCDSGCAAACMSCGLDGSHGTCTAVTSGPDDLCATTCTGNLRKNGLCGPASEGVGQCAAAAPCPGWYICAADGTNCASDCSGPAGCASGYHCDLDSDSGSGTCVADH
jgi:hypothetical protein